MLFKTFHLNFLLQLLCVRILEKSFILSLMRLSNKSVLKIDAISGFRFFYMAFFYEFNNRQPRSILTLSGDTLYYTIFVYGNTANLIGVLFINSK